ncbi:hypothetical protein BKA66DRAFT_430646 [Pyrenochaeta sp. MPI-SDFR-AT-0127]|nr:hypothetical protein BKA66DRAFT_430646 [Pyrenochaeta sp. MPI-SDFR-AT-0127]
MAEPVTWPPSEGLTSKIIPRKNAVLQLSYSINVRAPAPRVFDSILHVAEYPKWNTWVPSARILTQPLSSEPDFDPNDFSHMRVGSVMNFGVVMDANKPSKVTPTPLKVVDICTPTNPSSYLSPDLLADPTFTADLSKVYRVSWTGEGGFSNYGMKLERFHEVIVIDEHDCEVRSWEIMSGILSQVVKLMYERTLREKLGLWCRDLKTYCEQPHAHLTAL